MLSMIAAVDENFGIGYKNDLPWNIPEDLAYFKKVTLGHDIIMGKNTYASIGRPLPKRTNYVITKDGKDGYPDAVILIDDPIAFFKEASSSEEEVFIIGGASIYKLALPYADRIYLTHISESFEVDTFFPKLPDEYQEVSSSWNDDKMLNFVIYEK